MDKNHDTIKEMLGPIAHHPEYMDAINITTFDPAAEFGKMPPSLVQETLTERYAKDTMPNLRADMYRSVILYNYGGIWMDADTLLMRDIAPLVGEDWAYLVQGKRGAIEGALLSASRPRSHFANEYLITTVMRAPPIEELPEHPKPILVDIFDKDPVHSTMHVLPPCFMDSDPVPASRDMAVLTSGATLGSRFFGETVARHYQGFFSVGVQEALEDESTGDVSALQQDVTAEADYVGEEKSVATTPYWAYHWRGNFGAAWVPGSLADVAERTFMKKLKLLRKH
jgi:hypothetical protein